MYAIDKIKQNIAKEINALVNSEIVDPGNLVYPPSGDMGDLSLGCFVLAKNLSKNPAEIAQMLSERLKTGSVIKEYSTVGPYLNIKLDKSVLAFDVLSAIDSDKDKYGTNDSGAGQKILIEFSNVNTHKEYHIGHLRNLCYGDTIGRILRANGYQSLPVSYINDFGSHVAKTVWGLKNFYLKDQSGENAETDLGQFTSLANKGAFLGKIYAQASAVIKDDETAKKESEAVMKKIESRKGYEYELWEKTRVWSIAQFAEIYQEFSVDFIKTYYESEYIDQGRELVRELLEKNFLKHSQGAVIADLEQFDLGVLVVLRSDGTATYPVADIPLSMAKFKEFSPDASLYVVDKRQALYFKQLFWIMKMLDYKKPMIHLGYDVVKLPTGMMSSRTGHIITYEELKERLLASAISETKARHPEWLEEKISFVALGLIKATIKFEMLKVGQEQVITFDIGKALSFSGFTSAYLLYTCARIRSILRKSGAMDGTENTKEGAKPHMWRNLFGKNKIQSTIKPGIISEKLTETKEHDLIMALAKYPAAVKEAGKEFNPSEIARYIFELAQGLNDYYHEVPILKAPDASVRSARLSLIAAVNQVLANGLELLGIETLEEM